MSNVKLLKESQVLKLEKSIRQNNCLKATLDRIEPFNPNPPKWKKDQQKVIKRQSSMILFLLKYIPVVIIVGKVCTALIKNPPL